MKPLICSIMMAYLTASPASAQVLPSQLNIVIVNGDGAVNDARQHLATAPTVRIEDELHKPVPNAVVVFTLPTEGATGEFAYHSRTLTVITDSEGQAVAKGLRTNQVVGKVPIHINGSSRGLMARGNITQYNVIGEGEHAGHGRGNVVAILLLLGGAAGGAAYFALRHSKSAPSGASAAVPAPIGIAPGTGTIGAPH